MSQETPISFQSTLKHVVEGKLLSAKDIDTFLTTLIDQPFDDATAAAVLTALRMRGEHPSEIAQAVRTLRRFQVGLKTDGHVLDTCGTGGDDSGTFNISTAVSIVVAACGVKVVKHGNRAVSSKSGSADVLLQLQVPINDGVEWAQETFQRLGYGFCFAPLFHPALAKIAPLRRHLGIRTIFNLLGPLLNPAGAAFHLLGVGIPNLLDTLAYTLSELQCKRAILVSGRNRLDEVSLSGPTDVRIVEGTKIRKMVWQPSDFGLEEVKLNEIQAADAVDSARIIESVLQGEQGPAERIVVANAAAGLMAMGKANQLPNGVAMAREAISSSRANDLLQQLKIKPLG